MYRSHPGVGGIICVQIIKCAGQNGIMWHPCVYFGRLGYFFVTEVLNAMFDRKELISLAVLPEKLNISKSYNELRCHITNYGAI
jgi:hypothetical protein